MKLLVSKDITELTKEDIFGFLSKVICSSFDVEIVLFDSDIEDLARKSSIMEIFKDEGRFSLVGSEKHVNLMQKSLEEGVNKGCDAFLHVPRNVSLRDPNFDGSVVDKLFSSMSDENIHATICDYNQNGVLMVQNIPIIFCQRITKGKDTPINISENVAITKYIPLELYNVS
jgi:hypothetical protein